MKGRKSAWTWHLKFPLPILLSFLNAFIYCLNFLSHPSMQNSNYVFSLNIYPLNPGLSHSRDCFLRCKWWNNSTPLVEWELDGVMFLEIWNPGVWSLWLPCDITFQILCSLLLTHFSQMQNNNYYYWGGWHFVLFHCYNAYICVVFSSSLVLGEIKALKWEVQR